MKGFGMRLSDSLEKLTKESLTSLIIDLASLRKENKEWLELKLGGNADMPKSLAYFKNKIHSSIFNGRKPNLKEARKAISDFRKILDDKESILDLMIYYVEAGIELGMEYGDMYEQFYTSMETMFIDVVKRLNSTKNPALEDKFKLRLKRIAENATEGWGHKDTLEDWYEMLGKEMTEYE